jgi:hypothetical protein
VFYFSFFFFLPEDREEGDCVGYARGIKTKTDRTIKHAHKKKKLTIQLRRLVTILVGSSTIK